MSEHMVPEIFRTPLHELILSIKLLKLGTAGQFLSKCLEAPPVDAVIEAEVLLREMLAIDSNDELTQLGRILARLPVEPRLGKMMILGAMFSAASSEFSYATASLLLFCLHSFNFFAALFFMLMCLWLLTHMPFVSFRLMLW